MQQEEFDKEWREKLTADPATAVDFFRGVGQELQQSILDAVRREVGTVRTELQTRDPVYQANQDRIKMLVDNGMPIEGAIKFVAREQREKAEAEKAEGGGDLQAATKSVSQPGKVQPPGRTGDAARAAAGGTPRELVELGPGEEGMLRALGISGEKLDKFKAELGEQLAKAGAA